MKEKKTLRSLLGVIFLDQVYITITFPLLTLVFFDSQSRLFTPETAYATRSMWYGLCVALPNLINMFFAPVLSTLSDEFGRKKILILEIFSAFLFTLIVGLGVYFGWLLLIFLGFVIRGAFSRTNPTALTIIGDAASREKKVLYMSYLQFAISVGAFLGPILGGYFATNLAFPSFNFSFPFFISACLALINTLIATYLIRETLRKGNASRWQFVNAAAIKSVLTKPEVLRISAIMLLLQISWSTYYQFMPPLLKTQYGFNATQLGWFIGTIACWLALATSVWMKLLHRYLSIKQILLCSFYLVLLGLFITLFAIRQWLPANEIWLWIGALPVATGDVLAYSCLTALYSNAVAHEHQGKVMGISFIIVSSAWASTGFIGGLLLGISPLLPIMLAPLGIISLLLLVHLKLNKQLDAQYAV